MSPGATKEAAPRAERPCPHCGNQSVQRWGKSGGTQRYRCRGCRRTFNALTGTAFARLRSANLWVDYRAAMAERLSIRQAAEKCGIDPSTAFRWRRRLAGTPAAMPIPEPAGTAPGGAAVDPRMADAGGDPGADFVQWARASRGEDSGKIQRDRIANLFTVTGRSR
jgi:transposase-like protein